MLIVIIKNIEDITKTAQPRVSSILKKLKEKGMIDTQYDEKVKEIRYYHPIIKEIYYV